MRKICEAIGDFVFAAYWTVYAVLAVGPEPEGER